MNNANVRHCQWLPRYLSQHFFIEGFHVSPACPSEKTSITMKMSMEYWWNDIIWGNLLHSETSLSHSHFLTINVTRSDLGSNPAFIGNIPLF